MMYLEALRYRPEGRGLDSRWCHWTQVTQLLYQQLQIYKIYKIYILKYLKRSDNMHGITTKIGVIEICHCHYLPGCTMVLGST